MWNAFTSLLRSKNQAENQNDDRPMTEWRSKGYVQDSDEDDSISDSAAEDIVGEAHQDLQENASHTQNRHSSAASSQKLGKDAAAVQTLTPDQEQRAIRQPSPPRLLSPEFEDIDELQRDDTTQGVSTRRCRTSCRPSPRATSKDIFDVPSSQSEEAQQHSIGTPASSDREFTVVKQSQHQTSQSSKRQTSPVVVIPSQHDTREETPASRRTFRQRNPIQLHPYLLENEAYRQTLRKAGERPIHVEAQQRMQQQESLQDDTQWQEEDEDMVGGPTGIEDSGEPPFSSPPLRPQRSPSVSHPESWEDANELPSLEDMLHRRVEDGVSRGSKRQKIAHTAGHGKPVALSPLLEHSHTMNAPQEQRPPTPGTRSTGKLKKARLKQFRLPPNVGPAPLLTPGPSSDNDANRQGSVHIESEASEDEQHMSTTDRRRLPSASRTRSPSPSSSSSSSGPETHVKQMTKRIKGVLPASWLRLDQQAKRPKPPGQIRLPYTAQASAGEPQRGVAKRVIHRSSPTSPAGSRTVLEISEDSADEGSRKSAKTEDGARSLDATIPTGSLRAVDTQDLDEDDRIDPMLPSFTREHHSRKSSKRQVRLQDAFAQASRPDYSTKWHARKDEAATTARAPGSKRSRKPRQTKLSIVDAVKDASKESLPDFIRVAARRVSKRADRGRHTPSKKQISFHSFEDTQIAERRLGDWQRGRLKRWQPAPTRRADPHSVSRPPLQEQPNNRQNRLPPPIKLARDASVNLDKAPPNTAEITATLTKRAHPGKPRQTRLQAVPMPGQSSPKGDRPSAGRSHAGEDRRKRTGRQLKTAFSSRPGQLEEFHEQRQVEHPQDAFDDTLYDLNNEYSHRYRFEQRRANPLLDRFLSPDNEPMTRQDPGARPAGAKLARKRRPHQATSDRGPVVRLDFEEHFPAEVQPPTPAEETQSLSADALQGLQRYGGAYTNDFGVTELPLGTYFHSDTFVGSCEFQEALNTAKRILDERGNSTTTTLQSRTRLWGAWNEEVASDVQQIFANLFHGSEGQPQSTPLRAVIKHIAKSLYFLDNMDRQHFVQRMTSNILKALDELQNHTDFCHVYALIATLAYQVRCIAGSPVVTLEARKEADQGFRLAVQALAGYIIRQDGPLRTCYLKVCRSESSGCFLTEDAVTAESIVALHHMLRSAEIPGLSAMDAICGGLMSLEPASFNLLDSFEHAWSTLFHVLPFLLFDEQGIVRKREKQIASTNWSFVKAVLTRLFDLYMKTSTANGSTINAYIRANMSRCFALIRTWNWQNAEPILGCMFDFFAKRGFAYLQREGSRGLPAFLEHLNLDPHLSHDPADRSFDIFLKLLASCLRSMRSDYPPRKMKNLIWRFIPNHGRRLDKEADLREDDLDALRNQHNLLCVLYWVSPAEARLDCSHLQKIVDVKSSHAEAVRINIRAWINLVRHQLSTEDDVSSVEPLAAWFSNLVHESIGLHRMARTEAEASFSANASKGVAVASSLRESVIDRNERQVEGLLTMILVSMSALLHNAMNAALAKALFDKSSMSVVLALFDPRKPRLLRHVSLALDSYQVYFRTCLPSNRSSAQQNSDDSQDFGDWTDIDALADHNGNESENGEGFDTAFDQMRQLLSNCFGADGFFDDSFLTKTLDAWVIACETCTQLGRRHWTHFLDRQCSGSWFQLRETEQRRAYSPLFLAKVIASDKQAYEDNMSTVISVWTSSLVERESMLKYQHVLTSALLNVDRGSLMLHDLPFAASDASDTYDISLAELRERRLGLISSLLRNIRRSCEAPFEQDSVRMRKLRQDYSSLLRDMMSEMKKVYLETQQGTSLRGAYVDFVQRVVELLQQETADLIPIDQFFTDSGAFPLPATDPTYVVGRLKSYRRSLSDERSQKKLTLFLQITSERAAADSQQAYLVEQLTRSIEGLWEESDQTCPSLRSLLLEALFPCYLEQIFSSDCGWILALPILEATSRICVDLVYCFNRADRKLNSALSRTLAALTRPMHTAVAHISANQTLLNHPHVSSTLRAILATATSMLPLVDYHYRLTDIESEATNHLKYLHAFAFMLDRTSRSMPLPEHFDLNSEQYQTQADPSDAQHPRPFHSLTAFCTRELKDSLAKNWVRHETATGVEYFLIRGRDRKEVVVDLATPEKEVEDLLGVVEEFGKVWARMPGLREMDPWTRGWKVE